MNERLAAVTLRIDAIATDILVPLRRKTLNEAALLQLYEALDETYALLEHERQIDRELAAILFLLYSQLVTQSNYVYDKKPLRAAYRQAARVYPQKYSAVRFRMCSTHLTANLTAYAPDSSLTGWNGEHRLLLFIFLSIAKPWPVPLQYDNDNENQFQRNR
ncbi:hypothetical protein ACFTAO_30540 [Paenibacillus rhizoplanae]